MPVITSTSAISWQPVTTDTDGLPITVDDYEVAVAATAEDLNAGGITLASRSGITGLNTVLGSLAGVPGGLYRLWVRARAGAKFSLYAPSEEVQVQAAPQAPTGVTIHP